MIKRHSLIMGICILMILLDISAKVYSGGSTQNVNSEGFDWKNNYLSDIFGTAAIDGIDSSANIWAISGMLIMCGMFILFFIQFAQKIPSKGASWIIRICGIGSMVFAFLSVTPFHDEMIRIASILGLIAMFYITVFILKSKLHLLKFISILTLIMAYATNYIYFTQNYLEVLPIMQKLMILIFIVWTLSISYLSNSSDIEQTGQVRAQNP